MMIHDMFESIKLFIILNPMETAFLLVVVCTWTGSYLESVFKFWNWGPKCKNCKEWVIWDDSIVHCTSCNNQQNASQYKLGYIDGEHDVSKMYNAGY